MTPALYITLALVAAMGYLAAGLAARSAWIRSRRRRGSSS